MVFEVISDTFTSAFGAAEDDSEKAGHRRNVVEIVYKCDLVVFDFSAWNEHELNMATQLKTNIPTGAMVLETWFSKQKLPAEPEFPETGRDVIWIYKWCRSKATRSSGKERVYRFENNKFHSCY